MTASWTHRQAAGDSEKFLIPLNDHIKQFVWKFSSIESHLRARLKSLSTSYEYTFAFRIVHLLTNVQLDDGFLRIGDVGLRVHQLSDRVDAVLCLVGPLDIPLGGRLGLLRHLSCTAKLRMTEGPFFCKFVKRLSLKTKITPPCRSTQMTIDGGT